MMVQSDTLSYTGVLSTAITGAHSGNSGQNRGSVGALYISASHSYDETTAGVDNASITVNTMPSYYTVVYIIKVK